MDIINTMDEIFRLSVIPAHLKYLWDFRNANLKIPPIELNEIARKSRAIIERCNGVKTAFVVEKPDNTALTLLYTTEEKHEKFTREIFSTLPMAIEWLKQ